MNESMPKLRPQQRAVYQAIRDHGPATDADIAAILGLSGNSFRPRRREVADKGLIEVVDTRPTPRGRTTNVWAVVPTERIPEVRDAATRRKPRRRSVHDLPLERRLEVVRELLKDDVLNDALLETQGRSFRRARGRARGAQSEQERERREVQAQLAEAERERSILVHFLKAKRNLLRAVDVVRSVQEFVREDLQRAKHGERTRIPSRHWPEVAALLADVVAITEDTERLIGEQVGLTEDVIDVSAAEVEEIFELTEGDGGPRADHPRSQEPDG